MKVNAVNTKFMLSDKTLKNIEKHTRLSTEEIRTLSPEKIRALMIERGAIKAPNPIVNFLKKYIKKSV